MVNAAMLRRSRCRAEIMENPRRFWSPYPVVQRAAPRSRSAVKPFMERVVQLPKPTLSRFNTQVNGHVNDNRKRETEHKQRISTGNLVRP